MDMMKPKLNIGTLTVKRLIYNVITLYTYTTGHRKT